MGWCIFGVAWLYWRRYQYSPFYPGYNARSPPYSSIFSAKFPLIVDSLSDYKSRMVTNPYVIALRQSNFLMKSMRFSSATPMPRSRTRNMATDFWLAPSAFQLPDVLSSAVFCNIWPSNSLSHYLTGAISPQAFCPVDKRCVDRNSDGSFSPCPAPAPLRTAHSVCRGGRRGTISTPIRGVKYLNSKSNLSFDLRNCIF